MDLLFLGNLGQGEIIIIAGVGIVVLILPVLLVLLICGAFTSFPPDPQTLDTSKWKPIVTKIWNGVILYLIAGIIGTLFELFDTIQDFQSLFSASSPEELFKTWISNSVDILSGATLANLFRIIGFILYYTGLGEFSTFHQDNTTNYKITRLQSAAICGIMAIVLDYIPVFGGLASWIMTLVMYFIMASAFSYLRYSPVFNTKAKAGAGLLKTASVMYIIGMFLPWIGCFFNMLGFFMTIIGWGRIAGGGPIAPGYAQQPQYPVQPAAYTPPVPKPSPCQEDSESILDQHWMYCTKCGTKCKDYLKFCPRCGFGLHPEKEEPSSEYSSYAPPIKTPEELECNPLKENSQNVGSTISVIDNQTRPLVTKMGGAIHVENTVHPTVESNSQPSVKEEPKVVPQKTSISPSAASANKRGLWALIVFAVLLVGSFPAYLFWYKPYATDRDAPRYFTFTNLNLRSSKITDIKHNLLELLPYGTELITYSIDDDWASVKVGKQKGYVASNLILPMADFELLNSVWGNTNAKECINTAKCRLAVLDYYKRFNMSGGTEWQIYTRKKDDRVNTVYYKKLYNPNSKFADFTFIVRNNRTNERELVIYSFDDETEKPIFRKARRLFQNETGDIKSMASSKGWIDVLFTNGGWIQILVSG